MLKKYEPMRTLGRFSGPLWKQSLLTTICVKNLTWRVATFSLLSNGLGSVLNKQGNANPYNGLNLAPFKTFFPLAKLRAVKQWVGNFSPRSNQHCQSLLRTFFTRRPEKNIFVLASFLALGSKPQIERGRIESKLQLTSVRSSLVGASEICLGNGPWKRSFQVTYSLPQRERERCQVKLCHVCSGFVSSCVCTWA